MSDSTPINGIAPFLIVEDVSRSIGFYRDKLGFEVWHAEPEGSPFFAMLGRGGAMLMLKSVGVEPLPNPARHPDARWDAYVSTGDPDAMYAEVTSRGVTPSVDLDDTHDGLRGFEVADPDGHILFFGRPR